MKCSCKRTAVRLEKDYRQRSARHKLKKHNKMADEVRHISVERLLTLKFEYDDSALTDIIYLNQIQFLKQQVEYLREDGKNKHDPNEMLTIVETDGNVKISSSDRKGIVG